ncbi:MAG: hypothetical protein M3Y72_26905, partial [Acidobacteriota bacterium]|nr:hypothetical protein [Acidobacteriota bacterium]
IPGPLGAELKRVSPGVDVASRFGKGSTPFSFNSLRRSVRSRKVEGLVPVLRQDALVEQWRTLLDKKTPYRPSSAEVKAFVRRTRANRTKISRGYMHLGCTRMAAHTISKIAVDPSFS